MAIRGKCLCGEVSYEVSGPYPTAWHCHCSQCRRAHGACCGSYLGVEPENFKWLTGENLVRTYAPEDGGFLFCSRCGSNVAGSWKGEICQVTYGTMEGDPEAHPREHIFVGSKASWIDIGDGLPQHEEYPPDFDAG